MEGMLRSGEIQFRKAYLRSLVGSIEIMDGEIRVSGSKTALLAMAGRVTGPNGRCAQFGPRVRHHGDLNPGYLCERVPFNDPNKKSRLEF